MERLTKKMPGGRYGLVDGVKILDLNGMRMIVDRLAAFEEVFETPEDARNSKAMLANFRKYGAEPCDYETMKAAYEEARKAKADLNRIFDIFCGKRAPERERVAELIEADINGKAVILPCHIGDTLYDTRSSATAPRTLVVKSFTVHRSGVSYINAWCIEDENPVEIDLNDIGRIVFYSRNDATERRNEND